MREGTPLVLELTGVFETCRGRGAHEECGRGAGAGWARRGDPEVRALGSSVAEWSGQGHVCPQTQRGGHRLLGWEWGSGARG